MATQTWSITIVSNSGVTTFEVDAFGQSGNSLAAGTQDILCWNNQTDEAHWPWQTDDTYVIGSGANTQLCDDLPAWGTSNPGYVTGKVPTTIYYACKDHPKATSEQGTVVVS